MTTVNPNQHGPKMMRYKNLAGKSHSISTTAQGPTDQIILRNSNTQGGVASPSSPTGLLRGQITQGSPTGPGRGSGAKLRGVDGERNAATASPINARS
jgi:hypothetical protein